MRLKQRIDIFLKLVDIRKALDIYFERVNISEELKDTFTLTILEKYEKIRSFWKSNYDLRFPQVLINMGIIPNYSGFWYYIEEVEILLKLGIEPREFLFWGRNYDKDMHKLPKTEYLLIKDMNTDHIQAIIDGKWCISGIHYETFLKELERRK